MDMRKLSSMLDKIHKVVLGARWNADMKHSRDYFIESVKDAKYSVKMVTGELDHNIFEDPNVLEAMKDAISRDENPVTIEILCGDTPDAETKQIWEMAAESKGKLQILKLKERPSAHFALVDNGRWVRIEQYHDASEPERVAFIKKGTYFLGDILKGDFDNAKKHLVAR